MDILYTTVSLLLLCITNIVCEDDSKFRFDYTFNKQADGWLKFHKIPATWNNAKIRCHAEGAVLASPLNNALREEILNLVSQEPIEKIFSGVHAIFSPGDFASIEGIPINRLPITWSVGEPNNLDNSENCLIMMTKSKGTFGDVKCSEVHPYVCYKNRTAVSHNECGTIDKEYKHDNRTGSCYKFHTQGRDWARAYMTCVAEGGHLAIINSEEEFHALRELYATYSDDDILSRHPDTCHIGFRDMKDGGSWMTIQGQTLLQAGFSHWAGGQPDNSLVDSPEGEFCGSFLRTGLLNDVWCGAVSPFICEKKPDSLKDLKDT